MALGNKGSNTFKPLNSVQLGAWGKTMATGTVIDTALSVALGQSVSEALKDSLIGAAAFGIAPLPTSMYVWGQLGLVAAQAVPAINDMTRAKHYQNTLTGPVFNYQDTKPAYTMRQAAVQAIQGSKMNARNALGGEAVLMHRPYTIY